MSATFVLSIILYVSGFLTGGGFIMLLVGREAYLEGKRFAGQFVVPVILMAFGMLMATAFALAGGFGQ